MINLKIENRRTRRIVNGLLTFNVIYICGIYLIGLMTTLNVNCFEWSVLTDEVYRLILSSIWVIMNAFIFAANWYD